MTMAMAMTMMMMSRITGACWAQRGPQAPLRYGDDDDYFDEHDD